MVNLCQLNKEIASRFWQRNREATRTNKQVFF